MKRGRVSFRGFVLAAGIFRGFDSRRLLRSPELRDAPNTEQAEVHRRDQSSDPLITEGRRLHLQSLDTYTFTFPGAPAELVGLFRAYYGPTMNAFEAAAASGREADLQAELEALFSAQNASPSEDATSIPATFLRVTVAV